MKIQHFTDLNIWQASVLLTKKIYQITNKFPRTETYSLTDQIRRAASSIGANIAEGFGRFSQKEKIHFVFVSRGSLLEVQHFLYLSFELGYLEKESLEKLLEECHQLERSLNAYLVQLRKFSATK